MYIEGKLEVTVKFSSLPQASDVQNGHKQFFLQCGSYEVSVTLRPKNFNKLLKDTEAFPLWVAAVRGGIALLTDKGFSIDQPSIQVFERKPKEPKPEEEP